MTDRMTDEEFAEIEELDLATDTLEWGLRKAIRVEHAALKARDKEVDAISEWLIGITGTSGDAAFESITPDDLRGAIVELTTLRAKVAEMEAFRSAVIGWREKDHPEWFCRRTAQWMADNAEERSKPDHPELVRVKEQS